MGMRYVPPANPMPEPKKPRMPPTELPPRKSRQRSAAQKIEHISTMQLRTPHFEPGLIHSQMPATIPRNIAA